MQGIESRGIDPGQDLLQIFAGSSELDCGETGEGGAWPSRQKADVGFLGEGEVADVEAEEKGTRGWSRQRGWWQSPRVEGTRRGNYIKVKIDEMSGRKKHGDPGNEMR